MKFSKKQLRNAKNQVKVFKAEQKSKEEEIAQETNKEPDPVPELSEEDAKLLSSLSKKGKNVTLVNSNNLPKKQTSVKDIKKNISGNFKPASKPKMIWSFKKGDVVSFKLSHHDERKLGIYMRETSIESDYCDIAFSGGIRKVLKSLIRKI